MAAKVTALMSVALAAMQSAQWRVQRLCLSWQSRENTVSTQHVLAIRKINVIWLQAALSFNNFESQFPVKTEFFNRLHCNPSSLSRVTPSPFWCFLFVFVIECLITTGWNVLIFRMLNLGWRVSVKELHTFALQTPRYHVWWWHHPSYPVLPR